MGQKDFVKTTYKMSHNTLIINSIMSMSIITNAFRALEDRNPLPFMNFMVTRNAVLLA